MTLKIAPAYLRLRHRAEQEKYAHVDHWGAAEAKVGGTDASEAIQEVIDAVGKGGCIQFGSGAYVLDDTVKYVSQTMLIGCGRGDLGTVLSMPSANKPMLAHKSYFDAVSEPDIDGYSWIGHMRLIGSDDPADTSNHGIVLRDFYSRIYEVDSTLTGGNGFYLASESDAGETPGVQYGSGPSSLVENWLINCSARNNHGYALQVGDGNNHVTDGILANFISSQNNTNTQIHCYMNEPGGWKMDRLHVYGNGGVRTNGLYIDKAFNTQIGLFNSNNIGLTHIYLRQPLDNVQIGEMVCDMDNHSVGARALYVNDNTFDNAPHVSVNSIKLKRDETTGTCRALHMDGAPVIDLATMPTVSGAEAAGVDLWSTRNFRIGGTWYTTAARLGDASLRENTEKPAVGDTGIAETGGMYIKQTASATGVWQNMAGGSNITPS